MIADARVIEANTDAAQEEGNASTPKAAAYIPPEGYIQAARLQEVLEDQGYMSRQLFYSSIVPIFEEANLAHHRFRFTYLRADPAEWLIYAAYRKERIESTDPSWKWIKRRAWSLDDLELALSAHRNGWRPTK